MCSFIFEFASRFPHRFVCKSVEIAASRLINQNFELGDFELLGVDCNYSNVNACI